VLEKARQGELLDLTSYLDARELRASYGDYLVELVTDPAGGTYALPLRIEQKGLVWYPAKAFAEAGYQVPDTWDELVALSEQMASDGAVPWCVGFAGVSKWIGTDWIEALVLRIGDTDLYDRWVAHETPFSDPAVAEAFERFGQIVLRDDLVLGGRNGELTLWPATTEAALTNEPPACLLYFQGNFVQEWASPIKQPGRDLGVFVLPPLDVGGTAPLTAGAPLVVTGADRPEVRELIRWMVDPRFGEVWAATPGSSFTPANLRFDTAACTDADPAIAEYRARMCRAVQQAVATDDLRFDGSDLMPTAVGLFDPSTYALGAFYQGIDDYVRAGPDNLTQILATIDAAWPATGTG
jgi:alpha-glucoside transport system substrate-binding protein